MGRRRIPWPYIAVAAIGMGWIGATTGLGQHLEAAFADAGANALQHKVASDIVIVSIDAQSLAQLPGWPWPRRYYANLIDKLAQASPRRLFLDIDFSAPSNAEDDGRLISALARWDASPVILPTFRQYASLTSDELIVSQPIRGLRQYVTTASVNLRPSADGLVRWVHGAEALDGRVMAPVANQLGTSSAPSTDDIFIDYSIDPGSFHYVSFVDVLNNRIPAQYFADKTILVGATAIELGDIVAVPLHRALPGVVVHALAYESLQRGNHKLPPAVAYWFAVSGLTVLLSALFGRFSWRWNTLILVSSLVLVGIAALYAYAAQAIIIAVVPFGVAAVAVYLISTLQSLEAQTVRALMYAVGFRERDALLKSIVMSSTDCIICIDGSGAIRTANPAAVSLLASGSGSLTGKSVQPFLPSILDMTPSGPSRSFAVLPNAVAECEAVTEAGDRFPAELSISRVKLKHRRHHTVIVRDISERMAQRKQLQFQATHDPLTALPNRAALAAHVDKLLTRTNGDAKVSLLMIDLNRFKEVNDTLGHSVGDYVLYEVAQRFQRIAADHGFIARIGGDEFALVVEHVGNADVTSALSRALIDCLKRPILTSGIGIDVGLSVGIAVYPDNAADAESLFKYSDVAMYVAKRSGSGFEFYDSGNDQHTVRRLEIVSKLRSAIATDQLQLFYQPKVDLATGRVDSVEALLRWEDTALGVVSPEEFVTLAEPTDLIQPLSSWTLSQAFRQQARWAQAGLDLRIAVNLSTRLLQDASLPGRIADLMQDAGVAAQDIELEITESAMILDPQRALRVIHDLSALGVHIAIDDYGTGFSSLGYLRDLPVQSLKIDKSFVMNMQQHYDDRVIVESTLKMAHAMRLKVVAEGVETAADAQLLQRFGCDYAQGYYYSAALCADDLSAWVGQYHRQTDSAQPRLSPALSNASG